MPNGSRSIHCVYCGEAKAHMTMSLADTTSLTCESCETEFKMTEVEQIMVDWANLIRDLRKLDPLEG